MENVDDLSAEFKQGTPEWLAFRKTKITATDACVIMGVNPWKTMQQLYEEKISDECKYFTNARMQRGIDLEPLARELYIIKTGINVNPEVIVKGWMMASLDGISEDKQHIVEIKCPGDTDHLLAIEGKIPDHYYPQLQHQMYVCDVPSMDYFSFDGVDGVVVNVKRDDDYILNLVAEEWKFYGYVKDRNFSI